MSAATRPMAAPDLGHIPVSERELVYRLRRKLAHDGLTLRKLRNSLYADKPFVVERGAKIDTFLDLNGLEILARKLSVLRPTEELTP